MPGVGNVQGAAVLGADVLRPVPEPYYTIPTAADIAIARAAIVSEVWEGAGIPTGAPDSIEVGWNGQNVTGFDSCDRLTFNLGYSYVATAWLLRRTTDAADKCIIFHGGHGSPNDTAHGTSIENLRNAFNVPIMYVPMVFGSPSPGSITINGFTFGTHWGFANAAVQPEGMPLLQLFLDPALRAAKWARDTFGAVLFSGLSGGGWTTDLVASLDPGITLAASVAGGLPHNIRNKTDDAGDWEQVERGTVPVYERLSFAGMYAAGALEVGRTKIQVYNQFDDCCFRCDGRRLPLEGLERQARAVVSGDYSIYCTYGVTLHAFHPAAVEHVKAVIGW